MTVLPFCWTVSTHVLQLRRPEKVVPTESFSLSFDLVLLKAHVYLTKDQNVESGLCLSSDIWEKVLLTPLSYFNAIPF